MIQTTLRRRSIRSGVIAATTFAGCLASTVGHADYWDRYGRAQAATDFASNMLGVVAGAAAADREARSKHCWQEERRVKTGRDRSVIRRVEVCE